MGDLLLISAAAIAALMLLTWVVSLVVADASIVDMVWGFGFVVAAWAAYLAASGDGPRPLLVTLMVTVWGLRLSGHLVWRNLGEPEDYRYRAMRAQAPDRFWIISLFNVFLLQGLIMWVVAIPVVVVQEGNGDLFWLDLIGVAVWLVGVVFEGVGDLQLARFKQQRDSEGKVMDQGLWRYTRHPNYFGDFCVWWGLYLVAMAGGAWWTVFSPLLMSFLLLRVSGVAMLEKTIGSRRPGYDEYVRRTNVFFPGPRKPA